MREFMSDKARFFQNIFPLFGCGSHSYRPLMYVFYAVLLPMDFQGVTYEQ